MSTVSFNEKFDILKRKGNKYSPTHTPIKKIKKKAIEDDWQTWNVKLTVFPFGLKAWQFDAQKKKKK